MFIYFIAVSVKEKSIKITKICSHCFFQEIYILKPLKESHLILKEYIVHVRYHESFTVCAIILHTLYLLYVHTLVIQ